jgi:ribonuclease Z
MPLSVKILGSNSSIPSTTRNSSSHLVSIEGKNFLVDCAEATQIQLRKFHVKIQSIEGIFISHLHGDHYFGIMGLLSTMHLLGRTKELHIYAPAFLDKIIKTHNEATDKVLKYPLIFHPVDDSPNKLLLDDEMFTVNKIQLKHSVPSYGYIFRTKQKERKFKKEILINMDIHYTDIQRIKRGEDYQDEKGNLYRNRELTVDPEPCKSYAYCSDTAYSETIISSIKNVDLLYHESTFLNTDKELAKETLHSTAAQAALLAKKAKAGKLLIGHFSPRYSDTGLFLNEAKEVFPDTYLANDGDEYFL